MAAAERWTLPDAHALLVSVHDPLAAGLSRVRDEEVNAPAIRDHWSSGRMSAL